MSNPLKDLFSSASGRYAAYRPDYPAALSAWLAGQCAEVPAPMAELLPEWGDPETFRQLQWPLFLRVGTVR